MAQAPSRVNAAKSNPRNALTQFIVDVDLGDGDNEGVNPVFQDRFFQGQIETLTVPPLIFRQVDWPIFGDGKRWVDAGLDEMKFSMVSVNFSEGIFGLMGRYVMIRVLNGLYTGAGSGGARGGYERQLVVCGGPIIGVTPGEQKPGELARITIEQNTEIYMVNKGDYQSLNIDTINGIREIDGVDQLEAFTEALA